MKQLDEKNYELNRKSIRLLQIFNFYIEHFICNFLWSKLRASDSTRANSQDGIADTELMFKLRDKAWRKNLQEIKLLHGTNFFNVTSQDEKKNHKSTPYQLFHNSIHDLLKQCSYQGTINFHLVVISLLKNYITTF